MADGVLVIDSNIALAGLPLVKDLASNAKENSCQVIIPQAVISELDSMKSNSSSARAFARWLQIELEVNSPGIRLQRIAETSGTGAHGDDGILDCCLYFKKMSKVIVLLSDDRLLASRAMAENILTVSLFSGLTAALIYREIALRLNPQTPVDMDVWTEDIEMHDDSLQPEETVRTVNSDKPQPPNMFDLDADSKSQAWLFETAAKLCDYRIRQVYDPSELEYLDYKLPQTPKELRLTIKRFGLACLSEYLPRHLQREVDHWPSNHKKESEILSAIIIHLGGKISGYREEAGRHVE